MAQTDIWRQDSIEEVVVTGTGTRHLLKDAPVQTEVITQQMLSQYGGKSLEEILAGLTASFAFNEGDMGSQMQLNDCDAVILTSLLGRHKWLTA
jgi:outer membrane receptor for ferrienterochelin and colicins